jgi:hypothetical protein
MRMSKAELKEVKRILKLYSEHEFVFKPHKAVFKKLLNKLK